jgi:HEAT repeat protein/outer membrane protein assembly factor BamB
MVNMRWSLLGLVLATMGLVSCAPKSVGPDATSPTLENAKSGEKSAADVKTTVTDKGVSFSRTIGRYDTTWGYVDYNSQQNFLTVRDKASQEILLEVKPGDFPGANVPHTPAFWQIEGHLCVYGTISNGQGKVKAFDLSTKRLVYEIAAEALGPGELGGLRIINGRLYLSGNVEFKRGWVQLRQLVDGQIIWKLEEQDLPGWVAEVLLIGQRLVLSGCGAKGPWIEARDLAKGDKLWSTISDQGIYPPKVAAAGNTRVITLAMDQGTVVTCLEVETGKPLWKVSVKPTLSDLVMQKDVVLVRTDNREVAIHLPTGRVLSDTVHERKGADGVLSSRPSGTLSGTFTAEERKQMECLFPGGEQPAMLAMSWTMCHCATEAGKARAQKMFDTMEAYGQEDIVGFRAGGGAKGILDSLRKMLDDPDPVMRAFAAISLATAGQHGETDKIAKMMKSPSSRPAEWDETMTEVFVDIDRGRAAMALGILGAKKYADDMAAMLSDKNDNVRGGAALGLGYLKANQHAKAVAMLLHDPSDKIKMCAMSALGMMGAQAFAEDVAKLVEADGDPSVAETACFTLAQLGAMEQTPQIAALLGNEFKRGYAARSLAVLGARQYVKGIAKLLESPSSLDRKDALLALGLLNAKEYETAIAARLKDQEDFVVAAAAFALVLMNSTQYAAEIVPAFEKSGCYGLSDLLLSEDRQSKVESIAKNNFKVMKATGSTKP